MALLQVALVLGVLAATLRLWWIRSNKHTRLPPVPPALPIVGNLLGIRGTRNAFEGFVSGCREKYGPIFTIWFGQTPFILIADRAMAHQALIKQSAIFADRPKPGGFRKMFSSNGHSVNSAAHGPLWRSLRSNMVSGSFSHSSVAHFSSTRDWAFGKLIETLAHEAEHNGGIVQPREHMRDLIYRVMFTMCFGFRPADDVLAKLKATMWQIQSTLATIDDSPFSPLIPWKRKHLAEIRRAVREALLPHILAAESPSYVASLRDMRVHEDKRPLTENELVTLCTEFMVAGTDTTITVLEWCLARIVLDQRVQGTLYDEIRGVVQEKQSAVLNEDDVKGMKYLQAVVKETLRRHPPGHFVLSHAVHEDVEVGGYVIPAGSRLNFSVYGMAMDPAAWDKPDEFRPERFLEERAEADMTGTKEILFMPFGVGRRICPGMGLAVMHLSLFVARLVQAFKWDVVPGEGVDLSEAPVLTVMMQRPLRAVIADRSQSYRTSE